PFSELKIDKIKQVFPAALYAKPTNTNWINVYDSSKNLIGFVVSTLDFSDKIRGYAGPVPVLIGKDLNDKIVGVKLLDNNETPDVISYLDSEGFLDFWNGLSLDEARVKQIDAISGATITTSAVIANVKSGLGLKVDALHSGSLHKIILAGIVLLFSLFSFLFPKNLNKFRLILAGFSIIVFGFFTTTFLCVHLFYGWIVYGIFLKTDFLFLIILILSIGLPLITGRKFYCVYVCPYGFAQELTGKVIKKKIGLPQWVLRLRKVILGVIALLLVFGIDFDMSKIEPFSVFLFKASGLSVIILAEVFLVLSLFINKPWCRYFCPTGQALDLFKRD
ncbi:4Fe-4S binding protein, partial [bacterium]|nr:4Fe-4S binding protein [bacterium]